MCFSASASFGAGIVLAAISVAAIKKVQKPAQIYFACIPIIFCVQQFSEGFLWLALTKSVYAPLQPIATYMFLFFAQVVWPLWVPFASLKLEKEKEEKNFQMVLLVIGLLVSLFLGYCLVTYTVEAKIIGSHISYIQDYPIVFGGYGELLYIIATIAPPLFSNIKKMWLLSILIIISYIITKISYVDYVVSVWCFFSSIISISVLIIMDEIKNPSKKHSKYHYRSNHSKSSSI
ncbi:DUF6629 family protein [Flavobacterium gawalongense]|uniref:Uncharacterized protein n=1 Tax=Flavobacterium gawalongense TaxID=2594432 RepID=A0A553B955_9FLAO|nr:DUF6629 family protein [Flavobacterium gawalongense]TRW95622.1 hypothetical protein FNW33_17495 [Flavobacterium gawalongense]TRX00380.1 hypothetical protein FNW12_17600 [Flavobacterium gawalongense]TRX04789.1 hypothetical protein FNW11_17135 [Flavobacterium gawalongense]TRX07057.1 hypothetical protein FNW10_14880 [Flavobacterium gawalongense]TRX23175.1 hypothetical protein FNW38_15015 [Flavobacterium gawalongense]